MSHLVDKHFPPTPPPPAPMPEPSPEADARRLERIKGLVMELGALIAEEDASTGQGASTLSSVYWAIRDVYQDARKASDV